MMLKSDLLNSYLIPSKYLIVVIVNNCLKHRILLRQFSKLVLYSGNKSHSYLRNGIRKERK